LKWLDSDRDVAGQKYRIIQNGLIRIFASKGFSDAESLADEVINRVADRLPDIMPDYQGEPAHYFRGVANKIILEARRRKEIATDQLPERPLEVTNVSDEYECLLRCLKFSPPDKRDLLLDYHVYEGGDKIVNHQIMADELHISVSALRVQAHRARVRLEKCVRECVETLKGNESRSK
jgi:DNA-directed RNA polymerase specialized sigma24 family protein